MTCIVKSGKDIKWNEFWESRCIGGLIREIPRDIGDEGEEE
jgi:hypothetical protein